MRLKRGWVSGLVGLHSNRVIGVFLVLLVLTLFLVGLKPAQAQFEDTLITQVDAGSGSVSPNCPSPSGCMETSGDIVTVTALPSVVAVFIVVNGGGNRCLRWRSHQQSV